MVKEASEILYCIYYVGPKPQVKINTMWLYRYYIYTGFQTYCSVDIECDNKPLTTINVLASCIDHYSTHAKTTLHYGFPEKELQDDRKEHCSLRRCYSFQIY